MQCDEAAADSGVLCRLGPYMASLSTSQKRLINLYIGRMQAQDCPVAAKPLVPSLALLQPTC